MVVNSIAQRWALIAEWQRLLSFFNVIATCFHCSMAEAAVGFIEGAVGIGNAFAKQPGSSYYTAR